MKKDKDGLSELFLENLVFYNEYTKSLEENLYISQDFFESSLNQVEHFYPTARIFREQVHFAQVTKDGKMVSLVDYSNIYIWPTWLWQTCVYPMNK